MQLALMLVLAFFVYKLLKDKNRTVGAVAAAIIMLAPLPTPPIDQAALDFLHYRFLSLNPQSFSPTFYVGFALGNAHILQTILLVGAFYFGFAKKPWLSALMFVFASFDPRAALFTLPLLVWYNRQAIRPFIVGTVGFLALTNLPFFFYNHIGFSFLHTEVTGAIVKQMYPYDWLPLYTTATLMVVEILSVGILNRKKQISIVSAQQVSQDNEK